MTRESLGFQLLRSTTFLVMEFKLPQEISNQELAQLIISIREVNGETLIKI
jgi:hypothetical protein